jgi:RNA polymerase sigma-70 factor (ECF subfamily)
LTADEYNQGVRNFADNLFRFVVKHLRQEETAKDIVQDCFEKLWIRKEDVAFSKSRAYLFTMAYHTLVDHVRKWGRMQLTEQTAVMAGGYTTAFPDVQDVLHKALGTLPEIQKTVVLLRDYEGYSYEEIGEITGLTESQVKVYIYRARMSLKNYIGSLESII